MTSDLRGWRVDALSFVGEGGPGLVWEDIEEERWSVDGGWAEVVTVGLTGLVERVEEAERFEEGVGGDLIELARRRPEVLGVRWCPAGRVVAF